VLDAAARETGLSGQKVRDLLGAFLFTGTDVNKSLSDISGGEQRRLSLAILVASGANVLLLDEPTNHLDVESREALEDALLAFPGALILISHDRALLEAVGSRTLVCADGELSNHLKGWADYQREQDEERERAASSAAVQKAPRSSNAARGGSPGKERARAERSVASLEKKIEKAEAALASLEDELSDPGQWSTPEKSARATRRHDRARQKVADLYEMWEEAAT
jgi:ATP-binding cassette subfamily F protein 3